MVEVVMLDREFALHTVVDRRGPLLRRTQANHVRRGGIAVATLAPRAADAEGDALFMRLGAHRGEFVLRQIAAIGLTPGEQLLRDLGMAAGPRELIDGAAVPMAVEPAHAATKRVDCTPSRSGAVGVPHTRQAPAA